MRIVCVQDDHFVSLGVAHWSSPASLGGSEQLDLLLDGHGVCWGPLLLLGLMRLLTRRMNQ